MTVPEPLHPGWTFEYSLRQPSDLFFDAPADGAMVLVSARLVGYEDSDGWKMPSVKIGAWFSVHPEMLDEPESDRMLRSMAQAALYRQASRTFGPRPSPPADRHPRVTRALARWDRAVDRFRQPTL